MLGIAKKLFGTENDRKLKKLRPIVERINALEPQMEAMSDEQLKAQTDLFKARLEQGETLDDLLVEAFGTAGDELVVVHGTEHHDPPAHDDADEVFGLGADGAALRLGTRHPLI